MAWLIKHERASLNSLIKHAIEHGLGEELEKINTFDQTQADALYDTLLDFINFMEKSLLKSLETVQVDNKTKDAILPALQKIETDILDFKTVWLSMQQTKARVSKNHHKESQIQEVHAPINNGDAIAKHSPDATEILFERLLKNWKPTNKETVN